MSADKKNKIIVFFTIIIFFALFSYFSYNRIFIKDKNVANNQVIHRGKGWLNNTSNYSGSEMSFSIANSDSISFQYSTDSKADQGVEIVINDEIYTLHSPNIKGIKTKNSNLNKKFPYASNSFDVVISNYSIEHLYNTPMYVAETHRVLKKGGYTVVATDNLASWPNILSLMLGFQAFSTAFMVKGLTVGNPFALRSEGALIKGPAQDPNFASQWRHSEEFGHNKVLAYRGLIDTYKAFPFKVEQVRGVGYFPFFSFLSNLLSIVDPRHTHLLVMKARKI